MCERVVDHFPAGCVELGGEFFAAHRQDILQRILRCGESEAVRHPAERIKRMAAQGGRVEVWTSHARLAKRIGDFLEEQLGGQLSCHFERAPEVLRVAWRRENGLYAAKR